jgi:hypothetical protein
VILIRYRNSAGVAENGKQHVIEFFYNDYGRLGDIFLSHYLFAVKDFFGSPPFWEGRLREWACKKLLGAGAA